MTCRHVLDLIDAGLFANRTRAELEAARQHARTCATCGPAFEAADALTMRLAALAQPAAPPDLTGIVMARIARTDEADAATGSVAAATGEQRERSAVHGWLAAALAVVGLAAGLALVVSGYGASINVASPLGGGLTEGLVPMPATVSSAAVLTAGVGLYAAGLFTSLRVRSRA